MDNWKIFIAITLGFMFFRFLDNLIKLRSLKKLFADYKKYIRDRNISFNEKKPQIIKLFRQAKIEDFAINRLEPKGYGQLLSVQAKGFSNLNVIDEEVITIITQKFHEAIGVFKSRIYEVINPLFWIEFLLKLPTYILEYIGLEEKGKLSKFLQIIYWIIGIILGLEQLGLIKSWN